MGLTQSQLTGTQKSLIDAQTQLSSGKRVNQISDDPAAGAIALQLNKTLKDSDVCLTNLKNVSTNLSQADASLSDVSDILRQAQQIASATVGSDVTASERAADAEIINSYYTQVLALANTSLNGVYLFAGERSDSAAYASNLGGIQFNGTSNPQANKVDSAASLNFMVNASDVFGSAAVAAQSSSLNVSLTAGARLADLAGASGNGVTKGSFVLSDGTASATIDLSTADSVQDVINAINQANVGGISAQLNGNSIELNSGGAEVIVTETSGTIARDLGILKPAGTGGADLIGEPLNPKITPRTLLADLNAGAGVDTGSGLTLSNGLTTKTLDTSSCNTVQDVLNLINGAGMGALAKISDDGTGLQLMNTIQGLSLSLGENGGNTATDLGLRTFTPNAQLSGLNGGAGVSFSSTGADLRINATDGSQIDVDLSSCTTIQEVIDALNAAAGGTFTADFATTGNGIVLTDAAGGINPFSVSSLNGCTAAKDLGLNVTAASGVISGKDVNTTAVSGIFSSLAALRDALSTNNPAGITAAAGKLEEDLSRVIRVRGQVAAISQEAETRQNRIEDQKLTTKSLISDLVDVDYTEAATRIMALQTSLQAQLQVAGQIMNKSLLDYL